MRVGWVAKDRILHLQSPLVSDLDWGSFLWPKLLFKKKKKEKKKEEFVRFGDHFQSLLDLGPLVSWPAKLTWGCLNLA